MTNQWVVEERMRMSGSNVGQIYSAWAVCVLERVRIIRMHYLKLAQAHCVRKIVLPRSLALSAGQEVLQLEIGKGCWLRAS